MPTTVSSVETTTRTSYQISHSDPLFPAPPSKPTERRLVMSPGRATNDSGTDCDRLHVKEYTIPPGGTLDIDLAGSLKDPFGEPVAFSKVKEVRVHLKSGTASSVKVDNTAVNKCMDLNGTIQPNGELLYRIPTATGAPVTPDTADILRIVNNDGSVDAVVQVEIYGG